MLYGKCCAGYTWGDSGVILTAVFLHFTSLFVRAQSIPPTWRCGWFYVKFSGVIAPRAFQQLNT